MFGRLIALFRMFLPRWMVGDSLRSQQRALLRLLAVSHSQRLDPKTLVANLCEEHTGHYRKKLQRLVSWLAAGSNMASALRHTPGALSDDETLALQCGIENERLGATFHDLLQHDANDEGASAQEVIGKSLAYVTVTAIVAVLVVIFLMVLIVPTFEVMFEEFELALPSTMRGLIHFSQSVYGYLVVMLIAFAAVSVLCQFEDFRRFLRYSFASQMIFGSQKLRSASVLQLLALPTQIQQPLTATLTSAAHYHPDPHVRRRILAARAEASDDAAVWSQLAKQRLISNAEAEQLLKIESPALRAWAMRTLANQKRKRATNRTLVWAEIIQHVPILILGALIAWVVIAVMSSLTSMVNALA